MSAERLAAALADRYRIERELGEGGMATVYLAEDLKHHRQVAIKVLKPELAAVLGAERFIQEIATTAQLQHPNILPLFDSGRAVAPAGGHAGAGGEVFLYYVMPYVEGESLRDRLDREQQLGVEDAVGIAAEVADALGYAHEHGVVHRDIKPENILLHAGRPMVADFGIALAVSAAAGGRMTETGLSLGTPHYMSPEQATAEPDITGRSDIYSLGAVLYEMLTGDPPHTGRSAQQIIAKIVTEEPAPVTKLRKSVPPNVAGAVAKALEKLPADRFATAEGFAGALANPAFRYARGSLERASGAAALSDAAGVRRWKRLALAATAIATVAAVLAVVFAVWPPGRGSAESRAPTAGREVRFTVPVGADSGVFLGGMVNAAEGRPANPAIALSPDGTLLVYAGWKRGPEGKATSRLYRRPLDQGQAEPMQGTGGASYPFFSPDGKWIAFFAGGSLKRVPAGGGNVETIALDARIPGVGQPWGASWGADGLIYYSTIGSVYRVAAGGGQPTLVLSVGRDGSGADSTGAVQGYGQPVPLPGGQTLLVQRRVSVDPRKDEIVALDLASGKQTRLLTDATDPMYMPPGRLLFMRRGTLMEIGLDPARLKPDGQPRAILRDVMQASYMPVFNWDDNAGQVAFSRSGDLAYVPGGMYPEVPFTVERVNPKGRATPLDWEPRNYGEPRVSPGGGRVAYAAGHGGDAGLYVRDLSRGVTLRLDTRMPTNDDPVWSPDGTSVAFVAATGARPAMYRMPANNSGPPKRIAPYRRPEIPSSWSSRDVLAYVRTSSNGDADIWMLAPGGKPSPFVATKANEWEATFAPDGRDLAYVSDESGRPEVYVRPYPGPGAAIPVSSAGGISPAWSRDGRRIYYLERKTGAPPAMMVADVLSGHPLRVGRARTLIDPWPYSTSPGTRNYGVLADGSFLAIRLREPGGGLPASGPGPLGLGPLRDMFRVRNIEVVLNFLGHAGGAAR